MTKKVYVVGGYYSYSKLFADEDDYTIVGEMEDSDLVVFCGGEDVNPSLYGQHPHRTTSFNPDRDKEEVIEYRKAKELGIPCVGICRGGQFLHVMNGGELYQDVDGHATGQMHEVMLVGHESLNNGKLRVTSTHHQMMKKNWSNKNSIILMLAKESSNKVFMTGQVHPKRDIVQRLPKNSWEDVECIYYSDSNDLCFQPHPEFEGEDKKAMQNMFFFFINNYSFN